MCNDYRYTKSPDTLREEFSQLKIPPRFAGDATPNYPPYEDIRPNQTAPIIRGGSDGVELSVTPWAWTSSNGKPVFNFRSEGRSFAKSDRCLIPSDGFYEFTKPDDPKQRLKDKHLFTLAGEPWFWIAGLVKEGAFAMLTTSRGRTLRRTTTGRSWSCRELKVSSGSTSGSRKRRFFARCRRAASPTSRCGKRLVSTAE